MKNIADIDKNFKVEASLNLPDMKLYDVKQPPFSFYGVFHDGEKFLRIPDAVAETVSGAVRNLNHHTAGGRVRFKTDSPYIAIHAEMENITRMGHFAPCGSSGFDLYVGNKFYNSFVPSTDMESGYESFRDFATSEMREITIHFPLYSGVRELYIGLSENAVIEQASPYAVEVPVVYYGSSITQGGCASRPGMAYENILSTRLKIDHINLGFSGSAKAEDAIIAYLAEMTMSAFVLDYDHNAPTTEHLKNTHEKLFKAVRAKHPSLPIVIMNRPRQGLSAAEKDRLTIIRQTYENAKANGDQNVYFISGEELMAVAGDEGLVDGCHPTDLGFFSMATAIEPILRSILF